MGKKRFILTEIAFTLFSDPFGLFYSLARKKKLILILLYALLLLIGMYSYEVFKVAILILILMVINIGGAIRRKKQVESKASHEPISKSRGFKRDPYWFKEKATMRKKKSIPKGIAFTLFFGSLRTLLFVGMEKNVGSDSALCILLADWCGFIKYFGSSDIFSDTSGLKHRWCNMAQQAS